MNVYRYTGSVCIHQHSVKRQPYDFTYPRPWSESIKTEDSDELIIPFSCNYPLPPHHSYFFSLSFSVSTLLSVSPLLSAHYLFLHPTFSFSLLFTQCKHFVTTTHRLSSPYASFFKFMSNLLALPVSSLPEN